MVDFDDLLSLVVAEMARDGAFADAARWRYRHLFVDEYQDVNPLQHALLEAWRGGRPICASSATRSRPSTAGTAPTAAG